MKRLQSKIIPLALAFVLLMAGCSTPAPGDAGAASPAAASGSFSEEAVKAAAKEAIDYMNAKDFETITTDLVQKDAQEALSAAVLSSAYDQLLGDAGAFSEYAYSEYAEGKDENGTDYAVIAQEAKYANKDILYTIGFDKEMKIILFYMR